MYFERKIYIKILWKGCCIWFRKKWWKSENEKKQNSHTFFSFTHFLQLICIKSNTSHHYDYHNHDRYDHEQHHYDIKRKLCKFSCVFFFLSFLKKSESKEQWQKCKKRKNNNYICLPPVFRHVFLYAKNSYEPYEQQGLIKHTQRKKVAFSLRVRTHSLIQTLSKRDSYLLGMTYYNRTPALGKQ